MIDKICISHPQKRKGAIPTQSPGTAPSLFNIKPLEIAVYLSNPL
jgi:hypothetical protein